MRVLNRGIDISTKRYLEYFEKQEQPANLSSGGINVLHSDADFQKLRSNLEKQKEDLEIYGVPKEFPCICILGGITEKTELDEMGYCTVHFVQNLHFLYLDDAQSLLEASIEKENE